VRKNGKAWIPKHSITTICLPISPAEHPTYIKDESGRRRSTPLDVKIPQLDVNWIPRICLDLVFPLPKRAQRGSCRLRNRCAADLRAIFRLAAQDRLLTHNPAEMLFTPRRVVPGARRVLCPEQIEAILQVLDLREQLILRLALFSGMRPGEILTPGRTRIRLDFRKRASRRNHLWARL
jgi:integrase